MQTLRPEARALVEALAVENGTFDPPHYLDLLRQAGSRLEDGSFTVLAVRAGLTLPSLGEQPRLRKLLLGGLGLEAIDLTGCTALVDLDVSHNRLTKLALPLAAPLEILNASSNELTSIDLSAHRALARLDLMRNQLSVLDLADHRELRAVLLAGNARLSRLSLPAEAPLKTLSVSECALPSFDPRPHRRVETLHCDGLGLRALDVSQNVALVHLSCQRNALTTLDLSRNLALSHLSVDGNPLASLDVRALARLEALELDPEVVVRCTERQKRFIPSLREMFGLTAHEHIADMDLWELELVASSHNWDDGVERLLEIVRHPRCDLGTALKIYWLGAPEELSEHPTPDDATGHERSVVELLRTIEARVGEGGFATRLVRFEGAETEEPRIPAAMCAPLAAEEP